MNMPADATVADIKKMVVLAWELGVKALAVYRDGCKGGQPVTTLTPTQAIRAAQAVVTPPEAGNLDGIQRLIKAAWELATQDVPVPVPVRRRLPDTRPGIVHKFSVDGHEGYIQIGLYDDGRPGELFIRMAKEGSTLGGLMDAFATAVSIGLQYGVPLAVLCEKFAHTHYAPAGPTINPSIPTASSLTDYVFRFLDLRFSAGATLPRPGPLEAGPVCPGLPAAITTAHRIRTGAGICPNCGGMLIQAGTCRHCPTCFYSAGCS